jgi:hypothetical protein
MTKKKKVYDILGMDFICPTFVKSNIWKLKKNSQFYTLKKIPTFSLYFLVKNDTKMSLIPRYIFG